MGSSPMAMHVIPLDSGWELRRKGQLFPTSQHCTRRSAIKVARSIAAETGGDVIVHGLDGTIVVLPAIT